MENRGKKQREDRGVVASPLQLTLKVIMIPNKEKEKKEKKKRNIRNRVWTPTSFP